MNIPKEYILQCEKATKIQEMRKERINYGDYYYNRGKSNILGDWRICEYGSEDVKDYAYGIIWLPTQSQLQGMVYYKNEPLEDVFYDINDFAIHNGKIKSMEQLWLAFVMSEKYDKQFNGTDWVKKG